MSRPTYSYEGKREGYYWTHNTAWAGEKSTIYQPDGNTMAEANSFAAAETICCALNAETVEA